MTGVNPNLNQPIACHIIEVKKLAALWSTLTEYRNDIAHAQMRPTAISASTLQSFAEKELVQTLSELLSQWVA